MITVDREVLGGGIWIPGQRQRLQQLPPAAGIRPWPTCPAPGRAGKTTALALRRWDRDLPRRRLARRAASGRGAPATAPRRDAPAPLSRAGPLCSVRAC